MISQGSFCFLPEESWADGSKGNSARLDIGNYGFKSRSVHHEPTLDSGTNQLRRCKPTEFGLFNDVRTRPIEKKKHPASRENQ